MTHEMTLEIPVDPAYAVTARLFVVSAARELGLPDGTVDDLRLTASELVANAVEAGDLGPIRLALGIEGTDLCFDASGVGPLSDEPPISRRALLQALFEAGLLTHDGTVQIRLPMMAGTGSDQA